MAILASWSGAGLTDGAAVTSATAGSGDTAFTTVTASAATVDTTGLHSPRLQIDQAASTAAELIWDSTVVGTSLTAWAARCYVELSDWPPSNGGRLLSAYTASNTLMWFVDVTAAGLMRLRNAGGAAVATSAVALTVDAELRIEAVHDDGAVTVTVYTGDGTTALTSVSSTGLGTGSGLEAVRFGMPATSPTWPTLWLDEMAVADTAAEIGPATGPAVEAPAPRFPLQDRYELWLGTAWVDITGYVRESDPVVITRGRSAEAATADPSKLTLKLDNRTGRFSPRNPVSPYYGLVGRNTPIRASLPAARGYLRLHSSGTDSQMSCPSATALNVTDLDVRIALKASDWGGGNLCGKYSYPSDCSWFLDLGTTGRLFLIWSPDGTDANRVQAGTTVPIPPGLAAVRATLDVDNGSGGYTATFYTAAALAGPWTQLGDEVTGVGTTTIAASTADLEVGDISTIAGSGPDAYLYGFELRDGVDGTLVAAPDLDAQTAGSTSFSDDQGNTWTVAADAELDDRDYRFHGEIASWPATWAMNGVDAYVKITASGISRRLAQGAPALRSTMYRAHTSPEQTDIKAYWPCEDGQEATSIASGRAGAPPMTISGAPTLADYSDWTASEAMPTMQTGRLSGTVPPYTATGAVMVYMFVFVDEPPAAETSLLKIVTTGSARRWEVRLLTNGNLRTSAWDSGNTAIDDGAGALDTEVAFNLDGRGFVMLTLQLRQDGSDVDWTTGVNDFANTEAIGGSLTTVEISGTVTGKTLGRVTQVIVGADAALGNTKISHIVVADEVDKWLTDVADGVRAWNGEDPLDRMTRLCAEEGIGFAPVTKGQYGNQVTLGDQLSKSLLELLQECADTDGGILFEPRDMLGLAYRSRLSLYNQPAAITLDYGGRQIAGDLVPVDDDQETLNDLTVKRVAGSSVRMEQTTGPLSTAEPPTGVGRYDGEVSLSLQDDAQLPDQASWRLHLSTVDEARYPTLMVNMRTSGITDDIADQVQALDVGDRLVVTGVPAGLPPDDVSLLVVGYTETLRLMEHVLEFHLIPESPWHVGVTDDQDYGRFDTAGAALDADATSTATSLSVATTSGPIWTTDAGDFPFDILVGGERVTVSAISGSSSPQTFTVVRSVNGVVKAQTAGAGVVLADPTVIAL